MIAIETTHPHTRAQAAWLALESIASPKAAYRRRRADRLAALEKGRKALDRLRAIPSRPTLPPHLADAVMAIETLEAAVLSLDSISQRLADAEEMVVAADHAGGDAPLPQDAEDAARALLAERYDELREDIDRIARTAYAGRVNLLDGLGGELTVPLDARGRARAAIPGVDATSETDGLALPPPEQAFATAAERAAIRQAILAARQQANAYAARFEVDAALLAARVQPLQDNLPVTAPAEKHA
jgi:hypothetical protein